MVMVLSVLANARVKKIETKNKYQIQVKIISNGDNNFILCNQCRPFICT